MSQLADKMKPELPNCSPRPVNCLLLPSLRKAAFTMVELLVVIAVIILMLGLMIPAISGFSSTYNRRKAVNAVMNTLEQARVAALQSGENVHVIFARRQDPYEDALIVMGDPPTGSTNTNRVFYTRWIKMPQNVRFRTLNNSLTTTDLPSGITTTEISKGGRLDGNPSFSAITFNSTGQVEYPPPGSADNLRLILFEGMRNPTETASGGSSQGTQNLSEAGLYEIISLSRYTGRARLDVSAIQ